MNFNKNYLNTLNLVIVIAFVTTILIIPTIELSFAKKDNDNNKVDDRKSKKHISIATIDKDKEKALDDHLKEPNEQEITLSPRYPDQFFVCGYPQQVITDYNSFEQINYCN